MNVLQVDYVNYFIKHDLYYLHRTYEVLASSYHLKYKYLNEFLPLIPQAKAKYFTTIVTISYLLIAND